METRRYYPLFFMSFRLIHWQGKKQIYSFLAKKSAGIRPFDVITFFIVLSFILLNAYKSFQFNQFLTNPENTISNEFKNHVFLNVLAIGSLFFMLTLRMRRPILFIIIYTGQLLFLISNLTYFFYYEGFLHLNQYIEMWPETIGLMRHSAVPFDPRTLSMFIDLPFFIAILFLYKRMDRTRNGSLRYATYLPCFLFLFTFSNWNPAKDGTPLEAMDDRYSSEVQTVKQFGLLTVDLMNIFKLNQNKKLINQLEICKRKVSSPGDPVPAKPNVLMIQVESMDAFSIQQKYQGKPIAPNLYAWCRKYVYYPYCLSYHKAGSTSDCEFSSINSTEALDDFPSIKIRNYDFPNSLARKFLKNQYNVEIFHGNRGEYFNRKIAFKKMGFPQFHDMLSMGLQEVNWGAPDGDVFNYVTNRIESVKEPFFFYVITMSSHEPFTFTQPYYQAPQFSKIKEERVKNYFTCISYVDKSIAAFVNKVRKMRPNTFIMIYGDHTPGLRNCSSFTQAAVDCTDNYYEFVPLIIISPDEKKHFETNVAASFLDVAPTALAASGCPYELYTYGENLLKDSTEMKIPFRQQWYDRKVLFNMVDKLRKGKDSFPKSN